MARLVFERLRTEGMFPGLPRPYAPLPEKEEAQARRQRRGHEVRLKDISTDSQLVVLERPEG